MSRTYVLINYFLDGPCGDCPKAFTCNSKTIDFCIEWEAWEEVERIMKELEEKVSE